MENSEIMMEDKDFVSGLLGLTKQSPTPFYAVKTMVVALEDVTFQQLNNQEKCIIKGLS